MQAANSQQGESSRANDQMPTSRKEFQPQHEVITISNDGESRTTHSNYLNPVREEFNLSDLSIIENDVRIYSKEAYKLQEEFFRGSTSCIHRVLPRLKENNGNSLYEPSMVSIGPYYYHLRDEKLKMAEDCKKKCFGSLLIKIHKDQDDKKIQTYMSCLQMIKGLEWEIKPCYSEVLEVTGLDFLRMMVLDACFIIEIIDTFGSETSDPSKSLAALEWMLPYFYRDFLLLENQIPFFVLEQIYGITSKNVVGRECKTKLRYAALEFFRNGMKKLDVNIFDFVSTIAAKTNYQYSTLHLLDLVRSSLIPIFDEQQGPEFPTKTTSIHCVSKLLLAGIKVSPVKAQSFLEVNFKKGVIEMPNIAINDLMRCFLLNCVAFEQCHKSSDKHFSVYATFLDCVVNTPKDIEYLLERNVIDNYLADDSEAADFINNAGKDLVFSTEKDFYLGKLFKDVDEHYRTKWKWTLARFRREFFDRPWLFLSAAGASLLVLGTLVQAIVASLIYKYKK